jgi:hypothetical protein
MKKHAILLLALLSISAPLQAEENPRSLPEITAPDIATFEGISWTKGRLPNQDGFRVKSAQVFLKEEGKSEKPVSIPLEVKYDLGRYNDTGEFRDPMGHIYLAVKPEHNGLKICLVAKNKIGTFRTESFLRELKGYSVAATTHFRGETGNTTQDYSYVVPTGESEIFTLVNSEGNMKVLTLKCEPVGTGQPM